MMREISWGLGICVSVMSVPDLVEGFTVSRLISLSYTPKGGTRASPPGEISFFGSVVCDCRTFVSRTAPSDIDPHLCRCAHYRLVYSKQRIDDAPGRQWKTMLVTARPPTDVGSPIPANVSHAISVTLPTWAANVGYEEGADWVVSKMQCGYPRFFVAKNIQKLANRCLLKFGTIGESAMLFPSSACAQRCREFLIEKGGREKRVHVVEVRDISPSATADIAGSLCCVLYETSLSSIAKQYWQHTGEGISSRLADYYLRQSETSTAETTQSSTTENVHAEFTKKNQNHNRHYSRAANTEKPIDRHNSSASAGDAEMLNRDQLVYLEERYGRNLNLQSVKQAKLAVRRRIAGSLTLDADVESALRLSENGSKNASGMNDHERVDESDVYLYPTGMTSIFHAHQIAMKSLENGTQRKSACFGFPYTDTLKILEKWGPGAIFYGRGDASDLESLEAMLVSGERLLALFCECPSNPLLRTPPLKQLRALADRFGFLIVIDETIGNFINVRVSQYADIVVSSLTKVFSGDSNVMGGSLILNPKGQFYQALKDTLKVDYEDNLWTEDAITLERNSRDFIGRIARINSNAEYLCDILLKCPWIQDLFYPKYGETKDNYEMIRAEHGGYGGLLSVVFPTVTEATIFYDALETAKGPSLGTNFTLVSPYTLLAHFTELPWAKESGVEESLVRISVGLESKEILASVFGKALRALDAWHAARTTESE